MRSGTRRGLLLAFTVFAVIASVRVSGYGQASGGTPVARPVRVESSASVTGTRAVGVESGVTQDAAQTLSLDRLERTLNPVSEVNPFAAKSWFVPTQAPVAAPIVVAAPVQVAPPLPFTYVGKVETDPGLWTVYLMRGEQSYALNKGDMFDGVYRFDGIENGNLVIEYLPLSAKQLLPIKTES